MNDDPLTGISYVLNENGLFAREEPPPTPPMPGVFIDEDELSSLDVEHYGRPADACERCSWCGAPVTGRPSNPYDEFGADDNDGDWPVETHEDICAARLAKKWRAANAREELAEVLADLDAVIERKP